MSKITLRPYQEEAVNSVFNYFATNSGNPIIVAPTASGKSLLIAEIIKIIYNSHPTERMIILTHVKELVKQDYEKIKLLCPEVPVGIYSAGLNKKEHAFNVTVAGIQSSYKKSHLFGWVDIIFVDECHTISPKSSTMYQKFISELKKTNPGLKVIGFTATPFRTKDGCLIDCENSIFTDICYDIKITELLKHGYICPLRSVEGNTQADMTGVRLGSDGDFNIKQMEERINQDEITQNAISEIIAEATEHDLKSWLIFCSGVEHAEIVRDVVRERGYSCEMVTGETPKDERQQILQDYKDGKITCISNFGVLTTGFDAPRIDLIGMLRATRSPGLWIQILGRGMRLFEGKSFCRVMDFAGNIARFGPINLITGKKKKINDEEIESENSAPVKMCPSCLAENPLAARQCFCCDYEFPEPEHAPLDHKAAIGEIIATEASLEAEYDVTDIVYRRHPGKNGKPDSLMVTYECGKVKASEWICFEHQGYPRKMASIWWHKRAPGTTIPNTISEAYNRLEELQEPRKLVLKRVLKDRYDISKHLDFQESRKSKKFQEPTWNLMVR